MVNGGQRKLSSPDLKETAQRCRGDLLTIIFIQMEESSLLDEMTTNLYWLELSLITLQSSASRKVE